jgi:SAM-dependent methyltransferase
MELVEYEVMAAVEHRHWWYDGMRAVSAALIAGAYGAHPRLDILDAGCGSAGNAALLCHYGRVVGVDLSMVALRHGQHNLPGSLACAKVTALPFDDARFDLVTSFDVLYHVQVHSELMALGEVWRVLRPGGRLLIRLPAFELLLSRHDRAVHTRRRYRLGELRALLNAANFVVERATYVNSLLFWPRLLQQGLTRVLPLLEHPRSDLELSSGPLNALLRLPLAAEARWLARGGGFLIGTSVVCLAQKPLLAT